MLRCTRMYTAAAAVHGSKVEEKGRHLLFNAGALLQGTMRIYTRRRSIRSDGGARGCAPPRCRGALSTEIAHCDLMKCLRGHFRVPGWGVEMVGRRIGTRSTLVGVSTSWAFEGQLGSPSIRNVLLCRSMDGCCALLSTLEVGTPSRGTRHKSCRKSRLGNSRTPRRLGAAGRS